MNNFLLWCLGCLAVMQLFKTFIDLLTSRIMIKCLKKRDDLHHEAFVIIGEQLNNMEEKNHVRFTEIMNYLDQIPYPEKSIRRRGPYRPRQKKGIEHKKTPPNE